MRIKSETGQDSQTFIIYTDKKLTLEDRLKIENKSMAGRNMHPVFQNMKGNDSATRNSILTGVIAVLYINTIQRTFSIGLN